MEIDLVSSIFMQLKLNVSVQRTFEAAGSWAIEVPRHRGIKIHSLVRGNCLIYLEGDTVPTPVKAGDSYLLPRGNAFTIASESSMTLAELKDQTQVQMGESHTIVNGGGDFVSNGLFFDFDSSFADILFMALPPLIVVPGATPQAEELVGNIRRFSSELKNTMIGKYLVLHQLAPVILLDLMRTFLSEMQGKASWFAAASESELSKVLNLIHKSYAERWTLQTLAEATGVSRSKLAAQFKSTIGIAPMEYLCRWRMEIARDQLENQGKNLAEVAKMIGYESESAFSASFLRVFKRRPGSFRKNKPSRGA